MNRFGKWVVFCVAIGALAFGTAAERRERWREGAGASEPVKVEKAKGADACTVSEAYENAGSWTRRPSSSRGRSSKCPRGSWERTGSPAGRQRGCGKGNEQPGGHHAGRPERRGRGDGEGYPPQRQGFRGGVQVPGDRRGGDRQTLAPPAGSVGSGSGEDETGILGHPSPHTDLPGPCRGAAPVPRNPGFPRGRFPGRFRSSCSRTTPRVRTTRRVRITPRVWTTRWVRTTPLVWTSTWVWSCPSRQHLGGPVP